MPRCNGTTYSSVSSDGRPPAVERFSPHRCPRARRTHALWHERLSSVLQVLDGLSRVRVSLTTTVPVAEESLPDLTTNRTANSAISYRTERTSEHLPKRMRLSTPRPKDRLQRRHPMH